MRSLLRQEEQRGEKPQRKFKHHVKRIKNQSYMMINKKCGALKKKLRDVDKSDNETKSLSSSYSTLSVIEPIRSSLMDLRNAVGFGKPKSPRHQIIRSISDATGMAVNSTQTQPLKFEEKLHESIHSSPSIITREKHREAENIRDHSISSESTSTEGVRVFPTPRDEPDSITIITEESGEVSSMGEQRDARDDKLTNLVNKEDLERILKTLALKDGFIDDECMNMTSSSSSTSSSSDNEDEDDSADDEADEMNWMQPGTSVDDYDCEVEERRGSLLHDLRDNIAIKYHQLQECMHRSTKSPDKQKSKDQSKPDSRPGEIKEQSPPQPPEIIVNESIDDTTDRFSPEPVIPTTIIDLLQQTDSQPSRPTFTSAPLDEPAYKTKDESNDYYSSEPELSQDDNTLDAYTRRSYSVSLNNVPPCPMNKLSNRSAIASPTKIRPKFRSPILQICPPTPTPTESESSPAETLSPGKLFPNFPVSPLSYLSVNTLKSSTSDWSLSNKPINHSQSLVTLSNHTNSASLLAPSTPLPIKHHRSSTDLASSTTGGIAADGTTILASSPVTKPTAPPSQPSSVPPTVAGVAGHIRNDSNASKTTPSPSKVAAQVSSMPSTSSATVAATSSGKDIEICRRSSDSDLSVTPKGNSICVPSERLMQATAQMRHNTAFTIKTTPDKLDMLEYPFLTMTKYPPGFILQLGPTCSSRSVKLLERVPNPDEPETRDSWWTEIRMEVRSHARAVCCNVVLGYTETTTICDDVCVLTAFGTAAVINVMYNRSALHMELPILKPAAMSASLDDHDITRDLKDVSIASTVVMSTSYSGPQKPPITNQVPPNSKYDCTMCHVPYNRTTVPFHVKTRKCAICRKGRVPDVFLTTIEIPDSLQMTGKGCLIQATIIRGKKDLRSESNAKEISDGLPFLEYELHRVMINKLKSKGMNAIFSFKAKVSIGDRLITLVATGTAVYLAALPPPEVPQIVGNQWTDPTRLNEAKRALLETFERNREIYQLKSMDPDSEPVDRQSDTDESDDEMGEMDFNAGHKDACVLEVDDIEDVEIISQLTEPVPPKGFHVVNTQTVPGLQDMEIVRNLQFFTQVWRAKTGPNITSRVLGAHFNRLCQTIYFKLRSMSPCAICDLKFLLDLAEGDEIQLLITGMALGLGEVNKFKNRRKTVNDASVATKKTQDDEFIFTLDEDQVMEALPTGPSTSAAAAAYGNYSLKLKKGSSPMGSKLAAGSRALKTFSLRDRYGVDITPLTYVPGGKIEKYLGNLNFFFIRESTSIRELGGISGFLHSFITELLAVVRAHITVLGGNAMVSFYMTELILDDNQHKNQAQCLVSVGGDVVYVSYHPDD